MPKTVVAMAFSPCSPRCNVRRLVVRWMQGSTVLLYFIGFATILRRVDVLSTQVMTDEV
jgi:hypothetical protein